MIMDAEEVPETPPPIATGGTPTIEMTAEDAAIISGEIPVTSIPPQPVTTPLALPAPSTGGRRRACPNCGFQHLVGQMLCLGCGASIIKASSTTGGARSKLTVGLGKRRLQSQRSEKQILAVVHGRFLGFEVCECEFNIELSRCGIPCLLNGIPVLIGMPGSICHHLAVYQPARCVAL